MKRNTTILFCIIAAVSLLAGSCQKSIFWPTRGDAVRFSVGTDAAATKAVYSGQGTSTIERIDWQAGDLIRIYCDQVNEPSEKYADYAVTSDITAKDNISKAHIEGTGGVGLRWGEGSHTFYGVYPSPEDEGSITTGISIHPYKPVELKSSVSKSINGAAVTAKLPAVQEVVGDITTSATDATLKIAAPDLKNMLMTAKSAVYNPETGIEDGDVFLAFTPLTTAVQFTITNQSKASLTLKSVSLTSASSALNGKFSVNIDNTSTPSSIDLDGDGSTEGAYDIKYSREYPECTYTGSVSDATRTVTINFASPVTLAYNADPAQSGKLTFTFFLQPCQDFNDLTFKLVKSDNSWMRTRLGYTDGSGILFPRFKKTSVTGVFVPEGAQWTVKYGPTVQSWDQDDTDIDPMPETAGDPFVTSWDTGIDDELTLKKQPVDLFSVSDTKKVRFTQGNLYWDGTTAPGSYKFEANQYDYRNFSGKTNDAAVINGVNTTTPAYTVGSFWWVKNTEVNIKPYDSVYGTPSPADAATDILFTNNTADTPNAGFTANGKTGIYRVLSESEWRYLAGSRTVNGGKGAGYTYSINITYCGVPGVALYPDNYSGSALTSGTSYTELPEGVVFLPASGFYSSTSFSSIGNIGAYLTSTSNNANSGTNMKLQISPASFAPFSNNREISIGIRLVEDFTE